MAGTFYLELCDMMRAMCDALNMNTERLKRVSELVEQMDTMETRLPQPTTSSAGDSIHAFP
jgi:DNA polymerase II large subunit